MALQQRKAVMTTSVVTARGRAKALSQWRGWCAPRTTMSPLLMHATRGGFGVCRAAKAAVGSSVAAGGVAEPNLVRARAAGKQAASFAGEQRAAGEIDAVH